MSSDEKIRLLFVERVEDEVEAKRTKRISQGAASLLARWPSYVASAIWCFVFILSLLTLLMLLIFILLVRQEKVVERNIYIPSKEDVAAGFIIKQEIQSEFCQQMISKNHEKRQDIPEKDLQIFDSGNNIFYILIHPLNKTSSCAVESVLRKCKDKNVFLLILKKNVNLKYENVLEESYRNLNRANIDGKKLLRGSPFEGQWRGDVRSLFKAALLTVWQFGGTVISEDLLMMNNNMYAENQEDCTVHPELMFCPHQCAAYIYNLIGETLKAPENISISGIIEASIVSFCGADHFINTGCPGVTRNPDVFSILEPRAMFVRLSDWLLDTEKAEIFKNCPITYRQDNRLARRTTKLKQIITTIKSTSIGPQSTKNLTTKKINNPSSYSTINKEKIDK